LGNLVGRNKGGNVYKYLNKKAEETFAGFVETQLKEAIDNIDKQMAVHDPKDVEFYRKMGSEANQVSNQILDMYYDLKADYAKYYAARSFELNSEYDQSGADKSFTVKGKLVKLSRAPGKEVIENAVNCEIDTLLWAMMKMKGYFLHSENTVKTARNHTYNSMPTTSQERKDDSHNDEF